MSFDLKCLLLTAKVTDNKSDIITKKSKEFQCLYECDIFHKQCHPFICLNQISITSDLKGNSQSMHLVCFTHFPLQ